MLVSCALGHSPTTAAFNSSLLENRCHPLSAAKGFQLATAQAALQTLSADDGPRRFLVADEVGLGKTVVARTVIQELIKRPRPLVVFYVSSNLNIAHQNRGKLLELLPTEDEQNAASAAADRLTLAANPKNRPSNDKLHLYTLTPDTSVPMSTSNSAPMPRDSARGGHVQMKKLIAFSS